MISETYITQQIRFGTEIISSLLVLVPGMTARG
jgi:hypothetical protein